MTPRGGIMSRFTIRVGLMAALAITASVSMAEPPGLPNPQDKKQDSDSQRPDGRFEPFKPEATISTAPVTIGGQAISYQAIAGTFVVHPKDWDDVPRDPKADKGGAAPAEESAEGKNPTAEASMFYVAYFKNGGGSRPVTFFYNGGPGSATLWLHQGGFGARRHVAAAAG